MSKYPFAHCSQNLDMEMEFSVAKITISAHPNFVHFLGLLYISEKICTFHFLPQTGIGPLQETNGCHLTIWKIQLPDLPLNFPMPEIFFLQMSELLSNKSMTEGSHFLYKPISRKFSQLVLNLVFCQSPAGRPLVTCSFLKLCKMKTYWSFQSTKF